MNIERCKIKRPSNKTRQSRAPRSNLLGHYKIILPCRITENNLWPTPPSNPKPTSSPHLSKELAAAEPNIAAKTIYCGPINAFYDFKLGTLEYRSLRFETETLDEADHQGVAVVNYTEREVPYTRIIEHKHFEFGTQDRTVITREYPADWKPGDEPYYPINDARNEALYKRYEELAAQEGDIIFAGRLGGYKYYDMDKAIAAAFELVRNELGVEPTEA
ncbi:UDP-galactopyranose mutase [Collinsella aerofaciens]|uniref:UDP-galactopyranose mutase n=1 Tax=Collinsella aerofaciens TaxID=74426 RepID=UPI002FE4C7F5